MNEAERVHGSGSDHCDYLVQSKKLWEESVSTPRHGSEKLLAPGFQIRQGPTRFMLSLESSTLTAGPATSVVHGFPLAYLIAEITSTPPLVPRTSAHLFAQEKVLLSCEDFHQGRCISYT